jgi:hypothetical protein
MLQEGGIAKADKGWYQVREIIPNKTKSKR